jgi:hypothetical protein
MNSDDETESRRRLLRDISAGVLVAGATASFAQAAPRNSGGGSGSSSGGSGSGGSGSAGAGPAAMPDYPHPPFPKQQQEWPGLASKMTSRPDHGEASYKGSGRLLGRKALLTGGDSGIGRAAAIGARAARPSHFPATSATKPSVANWWRMPRRSWAGSISW